MNTTHFYKWWIVVACTVISACSSGIFVYAFTAFFNPIADEFQWSYTLVSLAYSFRSFETGIAAPFVGIACDRIGPRKILTLGVIITGLGYMLVAAIQNLWSLYLIFIFLSVGMSLCGLIATMTFVLQWSGEKTSLAMGILTAGAPIGALMTPVITALIDSCGWRQTVVIIGIVFWLVCIPIVLSLKNPPPASDDMSRESKHKGKQRKHGESFTIKQALQNKVFWMLSAAVMFGAIAGMAVTVHQMPHLINIGMSRQFAAFSVSIFAITNILGRLLFGAIGDRFDKRKCFAIAAALKVSGILFLGFSNTAYFVLFSVVVLGFGFSGLQPLRPGLQIQLFGAENFGSLQGILVIFMTIGSIISPLFAGWMFDILGNYKIAFVILAGFTAIAIPIVLSLPKKRSLLT